MVSVQFSVRAYRIPPPHRSVQVSITVQRSRTVNLNPTNRHGYRSNCPTPTPKTPC